MPVPPGKYGRFEYGGLPVKVAVFVIALRDNIFRHCPVSMQLARFASDLAPYGFIARSDWSWHHSGRPKPADRDPCFTQRQ